jgi:putative ABC transport system permease protein
VTSILQDIQYAGRGLRKAPLFAAIAVTSVALGIGANAAVFTLLDQVVLRMMPVKDPAALVQVRAADGSESYGGGMGDGSELSYPMYTDFRDHNAVFDGMFCRYTDAMHVGDGGRSERVNGEMVSGTFFQVLGVSAALGRTLEPSDDRVLSGSPVAVLSYDYWRARFGGRPDVLGRKLVINGHPFTVVGVSRQGFTGLDLGNPPQVYVPITMQPQLGPAWLKIDTRRFRWVQVFGRLRNGVSHEQARAALQPYMHAMLELESKDPAFATSSAETRKKFIETRLVVDSIARGKSGLRDSVTLPLQILMAVAAGVLLIACLNVANLLLARGTARHRELALRLALGASRGRIVGLLLVESLLIAVFGAIGGLLLAWWGSGLLLTFYSTPDSPIGVSPSPDVRILLFTMVTATLAAVLAGLVPAWASTRLNIAPTLKSSGGAVLGEQPRLRKSFVVAQVALSFLLLAGAGLFLRSLTNLLKVDTGMRVDHVLAFSVDLARSGYTAPRDRQFADRLMETLQSTPGVKSAGYAFFGVLEGGAWGMGFTLEGRQPKPNQFFGALCNAITPGFFPTLGVQLVAGRNFTERDARTPPADEKGWPYRTAIVNEEFVKKYYDGVNPIGRHIGFGEDPGTATPIEIVGVVRTSKYVSIREDPRPQAFFPYSESSGIERATIYLRTAEDPNSMASQVRRRVATLDPDLPVYSLHTLEDQVGQSVANDRLIASLSTVFSVLATALAMVGLYGVMAYTVTRRTREIGIRMALGALASDVARRILSEAGVLVAVGLAIGIAGSLWLGRYVQSQLYGLKALDTPTFVSAALGLALIATLAAFLPARRAARVSPMTALREE